MGSGDSRLKITERGVSVIGMTAGQFWVRPDEVGTSNEELGAIARGEVAQERIAEIDARVALAQHTLAHMMPAGIKPWMSDRRMMT